MLKLVMVHLYWKGGNSIKCVVRTAALKGEHTGRASSRCDGSVGEVLPAWGLVRAGWWRRPSSEKYTGQDSRF